MVDPVGITRALLLLGAFAAGVFVGVCDPERLHVCNQLVAQEVETLP